MLLNRVVTLIIFYIRFTLQTTWKEIIFQIIWIITKIKRTTFFLLNFDKIERRDENTIFLVQEALHVFIFARDNSFIKCRADVWLRYKEKCLLYIYISRIIDFKIMYGIQRRLVSNDCTKVTDPWRKAGLGSCNLYDTLLPCLSATRIPANLSFSLSPPLYRVGKSSLRLLCVIRQAGLDTR